MVTEEFTHVKRTHFRVQPVILVHVFERFDTYYDTDAVKLHKLRQVNPLTPRRTHVFSYKRRAYESVDEKSLSLVMARKTTKKRIWSLKG